MREGNQQEKNILPGDQVINEPTSTRIAAAALLLQAPLTHHTER